VTCSVLCSALPCPVSYIPSADPFLWAYVYVIRMEGIDGLYIGDQINWMQAAS
jgi:hypothetical protein